MQRKKSHLGFSFVEILVGLVLVSGLVFAAYKIFLKTTSSSKKAISSARDVRQTERVLDQIRLQISNAIPIDDASTPLKYNQMSSPNGGAEYPSSIMAFPGYYRENFTSSMTSFDPSSVNVGSLPADAIRIVNIAQDSSLRPLYKDTSTGLTEPTNDANTRIRVADAAGYQKFSVGDYFLLSDGLGTRLGRITAKNKSGPAYYLIHGDQSVWNVDRTTSRNYGRDLTGNALTGGAFIQKARVYTYAVSTKFKHLAMNDHIYDDRFNPVKQVFGGPGEAHKWIPLLKEVNALTIKYRVDDGAGAGISKRTPANGPIGVSELMSPKLRYVSLNLLKGGRTYEQLAQPSDLNPALETQGDPFALAPNASATPGTPILPTFPSPSGTTPTAPPSGTPTPTGTAPPACTNTDQYFPAPRLYNECQVCLSSGLSTLRIQHRKNSVVSGVCTEQGESRYRNCNNVWSTTNYVLIVKQGTQAQTQFVCE